MAAQVADEIGATDALKPATVFESSEALDPFAVGDVDRVVGEQLAVGLVAADLHGDLGVDRVQLEGARIRRLGLNALGEVFKKLIAALGP